jgi:uncharacterized protein (TIGR02145 family)
VNDVDNNTYPVVVIGKQAWLGANLRTTRTLDGSPLITHAPNNDSTTSRGFGLLYDWVNAQQACLRGWHLPSDSEWSVLAAQLGPDAGGALKDTVFWSAPNAGATNRSGFSARPSGYWSREEFESLFGRTVVYWSATPQDTHFVWTRTLASAHDSLRRVGQHPNYGLAVRCVKAP